MVNSWLKESFEPWIMAHDELRLIRLQKGLIILDSNFNMPKNIGEDFEMINARQTMA